jgi:MFS family permease
VTAFGHSAVRVVALATFLFAVAVGAILSVLPVYMVEVLGAGVFVVGLVEGVAALVESATLIAAGWLSDRFGRRKPLAVVGYGLYLMVKPAYLLFGTLLPVACARVADRFAVAVFSAPQQALLGDAAATGRRGAAYGLRTAADGLGATTGPLLATLALGAWGLGYPGVFWAALIASAAAFVVFAVGVRDVARALPVDRPPIDWRALFSLGRACNVVLVAAGGIWLAHLGEAFSLLMAMQVGMSKGLIPLVFMAAAVAQAAVAYPAGRLSDRFGRTRPLMAGVLALAAGLATLAWADGAVPVLVGAALVGVHGGLSVGLLAAMVADAAPPALRGTAFGAYQLVAGLAALVGLAAAGALWEAIGPAAMFTLWAALALVVLGGLWLARRAGALPS